MKPKNKGDGYYCAGCGYFANKDQPEECPKCKAEYSFDEWVEQSCSECNESEFTNQGDWTCGNQCEGY